MRILKKHCEEIANFIEITILDVIRKDDEIDSTEWVLNLLNIKNKLEKATARIDDTKVVDISSFLSNGEVKDIVLYFDDGAAAYIELFCGEDGFDVGGLKDFVDACAEFEQIYQTIQCEED